MELETSSEDAHAVRQQSGRQRVARKALIAISVHRERDGSRSIDMRLVCQAIGLSHDVCSSLAKRAPKISCVRVSRLTTSQLRHPNE
jgi:hypothetical protein